MDGWLSLQGDHYIENLSYFSRFPELINELELKWSTRLPIFLKLSQFNINFLEMNHYFWNKVYSAETSLKTDIFTGVFIGILREIMLPGLGLETRTSWLYTFSCCASRNSEKNFPSKIKVLLSFLTNMDKSFCRSNQFRENY